VQVVDTSGIANGSAVNYSVSAHNSAFGPLASWNSASGTGYPAGPPLYESGTPPTALPVGDDGTTVTLSWVGSFVPNGATITDYTAAAYPEGDTTPTCSSPGGQDVGTGTSTTFSGLTPNTPYDFIVFATNAQGCGTSDIVSLTTHPTPGTVTAINSSGPLSSGSNTWDFELNGVTIGSGSGTTNMFEYQLSGGSVDGSTYGPVAYNAPLTTSNNSEYGNDIQVQVKACNQYADGSMYCSDNWSQSFELGVPVDNSDLPGLSFSHDPFDLVTDVNGTWTWSSGLALGAYSSITYDCGNGPQTLDPNNPGSCATTETSPVSGDFPPLRIAIHANGATYVRTCDWSDYD
jgi:hypothetical protein